MINNILMLRFPELMSLFEEQLIIWGEQTPPTHCFFDGVLNAYVTELLRENKNKQQLEKIFNFYEEMAESKDIAVNNLLQVTLLEYLWDEKNIFMRAKEHMLPKTRVINDSINLYFNEPQI